jgi:hypothetical protein
MPADCDYAKLVRNIGDQAFFPGGLLTKRGRQDYHGATPALAGLLFFSDAHTPEVREQICQCFEEYEAIAKDHLNWLWRDEPPEGPDNLRYADAKPLREMVKRLDADDLVSFTYTSGKKSVDAGQWLFEVNGWRAWQARKGNCPLASMRFSLPHLFAYEHPIAFQKLFLSFARRLKAIHGYGGHALLLSPVRVTDNQPIETYMAERMNGLDVGTPVGVSRAMRNGIKTVSWLTAINSEMVDKAGGQASLRSELPGTWFALYDYGAGVVIQAGPEALPAMVDDDPKPASYVLPNMLLKDLRVPEIQSLHRVTGSAEPRITGHAAEEWMQRFDVPEDQLLHYKAKLLDEPKLTPESTLPDRIN